MEYIKKQNEIEDMEKKEIKNIKEDILQKL